MLLKMREDEEPEDLSVRRRHKSCQTENTSEHLLPFQKQILLRFSNLIEELRAHRHKDNKTRRKKRRTHSEFEEEEDDYDDENSALHEADEEDSNNNNKLDSDECPDQSPTVVKGGGCTDPVFSAKNYSTLIQLLSKLQRANLQMNQSLYGEPSTDSLCQDNNSSFPSRSAAVFANFSRGAASSTNPSSSSSNAAAAAAGDGDFPEFIQQQPQHPSVNTQTPLDFLNSSFHNAIIRPSDPDLLFPSGNESLRHHSAPSVRPPPSSSTLNSETGPLSQASPSFDGNETSSEFIHYSSNNDSVISGPVISPHDGCPYPNGSLYGGGASGLPPYPSLNHSYAAPPPQQQPPPQIAAAAPPFIKQEIKADLPTEHNNNELKRSLDQGYRNSTTLIKTEKDPYSSSSSSSSTSSVKNGTSSLSSSMRSRYSKDEKRARDLGIPFSIGDIVTLPMDEYNDMIARYTLTDEQLSLCRDIRRRGKNKVAAQNCRKRKINQITELKTTIELNREIQNRLIEQRSHLIRIREEYTELVLDAQRQYWSKSKYDPDLFEFRFSDDGSSVAVVPKISTSTREDVSDANYRR